MKKVFSKNIAIDKATINSLSKNDGVTMSR